MRLLRSWARWMAVVPIRSQGICRLRLGGRSASRRRLDGERQTFKRRSQSAECRRLPGGELRRRSARDGPRFGRRKNKTKRTLRPGRIFLYSQATTCRKSRAGRPSSPYPVFLHKENRFLDLPPRLVISLTAVKSLRGECASLGRSSSLSMGAPQERSRTKERGS